MTSKSRTAARRLAELIDPSILLAICGELVVIDLRVLEASKLDPERKWHSY